jgi:hypothetical protein
MTTNDEIPAATKTSHHLETGSGWEIDDNFGKRRFLIVAAVVCAAFVTIILPALLVRSPLGHDESVYALRASNLLGGWTFQSGNY